MEYKENLGKFQQYFFALRNNKFFEFTVMGVILLSAVLVGIKTFESSSNFHFIKVLDYFITLFFLSEVVVKLISYKDWKDYFKDAWNVFDFVIVAVSLIPLGSTQFVVIGRILRIFRVLRIVTVIPELKVLIESLIKSLPSITYISILLFVIFYIYAAIGSMLFVNVNEELWGNILLSLLTLFRIMTFEDWTDVMYETMAVYPHSWIFYLSFIFLTVFTFLNLFIGTVISTIDEERNKKRKEEEADSFKLIEKKLILIEKKFDKLDKN